jgi:hypothetical protein
MKFSLLLFKQHATTTRAEMEVQLHTFLISAVVSFMYLPALLPGKKLPLRPRCIPDAVRTLLQKQDVCRCRELRPDYSHSLSYPFPACSIFTMVTGLYFIKFN